MCPSGPIRQFFFPISMKPMTLYLSTLLLFLTACGSSSDGNDDVTAIQLSATPTQLTIPAEGQTASIAVSASREWAAFATNGETWFSVTPATGKGGSATLSVTVKENVNYEPREGQITVKAGSERQFITVSQEAATRPSITCPAGPDYKLVWHDEFDTDGTIDQQNGWTYQVANPGWVNNELQTYVNVASPEGREVATVKGGILSINCFKEGGKIYSGRVYAHQSTGWQYGYIEASIRLPKGKGTWPAFWMMPVNFHSWPADGEIDIMEEVGYHPNYVSSSLHATAHVHSNGTQVTHEMYCAGAEDEFHTYGMLWTADNITTYVDGKVQLSYNDTGKGRDDWPYNAPFYVILNLAWGGSWGGAQGVDESALPVSLDVDWVRVWQK